MWNLLWRKSTGNSYDASVQHDVRVKSEIKVFKVKAIVNLRSGFGLEEKDKIRIDKKAKEHRLNANVEPMSQPNGN